MGVKTVHPKTKDHQVELEYDGCLNNSDKPLFNGTYDECVQFLRNLPDRIWNDYIEDGWDFAIVNLTTKRVCSYVL